jgi:hypothetical protein
MTTIFSTREKESFIPGQGMTYVTARFSAPKGQEQAYPGEFSRHVILESFDEGAMRDLANGPLWAVVKERIFQETREGMLKEFIIVGRKKSGADPKEVNPFSLSLDRVKAALLETETQRVGKLTAESITKWAQSSGLLAALEDFQYSRLSDPENEAELTMATAKVKAGINLIAALAAQQLAEDKPRLAQCERILGYCPDSQDAFMLRLAARVVELRMPKMRKAEMEIETDF